MSRIVSALLAAACAMFAAAAAAQNNTITLVVPYTPGGPADQATRLVANELAQETGKTFIIENKPGAGGVAAAMNVIQSEPKGSKLLVASISTLSLNKGLYKNLPYDPDHDFIPIVGLTKSPMILVARPALPISALKGLAEYSKTKNGGLSMGSSGSGSIPHLAGTYFFKEAGVDFLHVPYKGIAPALVSLLSNDIDVIFDTLSTSTENIKAGKVKALGIASDHRFSGLPDLPTFKEQGYDFEVSSWFGLAAPAGTPKEVVEQLNRQVNAVLANPAFQQQLARLGLEPMTGTADQFASFVRAQGQQWLPELIRLNLQVD